MYEAFTFTKYDPGWMVTAVQSLAEDGDLDLSNQLSENPALAEDQIAIGVDGEWFPVHEILICFAALPFYFLLGINGCLLFNFLVAWGTAVGAYLLCRKFYNEPLSFIAAMLTCVGTILYRYSYSFSIELLGTFFITFSLLSALNRRWLSAGALFGLSVWARLGNFAAAPAFLILVYFSIRGSNKSAKPIIKFFAGAGPLALVWFYMNWLMFGSPLSTSYDNWAVNTGAGLTISSQRELFSASGITNIPRLIFDLKIGLLSSFPLTPIALLIGLPVLWKTHRHIAWFIVSISIVYLLFFSVYAGTLRGGGGNRHMMPLAVLYCLPLAAALSTLWNSVGNKSN